MCPRSMGRELLVSDLFLQLLEVVLHHDQLACLLDSDIPNHHEPLIVRRHITVWVPVMRSGYGDVPLAMTAWSRMATGPNCGGRPA